MWVGCSKAVGREEECAEDILDASAVLLLRDCVCKSLSINKQCFQGQNRLRLMQGDLAKKT